MHKALASLKGIQAELARVHKGRHRNLPADCKSAQEWMARLRKHRAKPLEDHGVLFPTDGLEVFKWATEVRSNRIAEKMQELAARDWTRQPKAEAVKQPVAQLVEKVKRQKTPKPDRLADYRDRRDVVLPEPTE